MDLSKQLRRMIAFIELEGIEKSLEIHNSADEEVNTKIGNWIISERLNINNYYSLLEKSLDKHRVTRRSRSLNEANHQLHKERCSNIDDIFREAEERAEKEVSNDWFYREFFLRSILQCLSTIMEASVGVRIRRKDDSLMTSVLPDVLDRYYEMSGVRVLFEVDQEVFLPDSVIGGVIMFAKEGKIMVDNTIKSRFHLIKESDQTSLRYSLFGSNPNRKYQF